MLAETVGTMAPAKKKENVEAVREAYERAVLYESEG
jgi:hypothetical protein